MRILTLLLVMSYSLAFSQAIKPPQKPSPTKSIVTKPASTLTPTIDLIQRISLLNQIAGMGIRAGLSTVHMVTPGKLSPLIPEMIEIEKDPLVLALKKKYSKNIQEYLDAIMGFGEGMKEIVLVDQENTPFQFTAFNNGLTFCQFGIFSESAYNTLKLTTDERAARVTKDIIMPSLPNFKSLTTIPEIQNYSIIVAFAAKDFSTESISGYDTETVAIIIDRGTLIKYVNAELTDEDVFKLASFYNVNKNTGINVKKILIK